MYKKYRTKQQKQTNRKKSNKIREMCGTGNNRAQSMTDNWRRALYIKARGWPPYSNNIHNSRQVKCLHVYDILCHNDYFSRWTYSYIGVPHARQTIVNIRLAPPCGTSASQAWVAKSKTFFVVRFEVWARSRNAKESTMHCQTKTSW